MLVFAAQIYVATAFVLCTVRVFVMLHNGNDMDMVHDILIRLMNMAGQGQSTPPFVISSLAVSDQKGSFTCFDICRDDLIPCIYGTLTG